MPEKIFMDTGFEMSRLTQAESEELGRTVLELEGPRVSQVWVRRRTERFIFNDERALTREVELQIDLSGWRQRLVRCNAGQPNVPIPLQTTGNDQRSVVEIFDETGTRIPYLNLNVERATVRNGLRDEVRQLFVEERDARIGFRWHPPIPTDEELDLFLEAGMRPVAWDDRPAGGCVLSRSWIYRPRMLSGDFRSRPSCIRSLKRGE